LQFRLHHQFDIFIFFNFILFSSHCWEFRGRAIVFRIIIFIQKWELGKMDISERQIIFIEFRKFTKIKYLFLIICLKKISKFHPKTWKGELENTR
jgi:hypothetical protein